MFNLHRHTATPAPTQGIASAPLWDTEASTINGVISASDFINILKRLRDSVSVGGNPMSEAEMDAHTIRGLREQVSMEGRGEIWGLSDWCASTLCKWPMHGRMARRSGQGEKLQGAAALTGPVLHSMDGHIKACH